MDIVDEIRTNREAGILRLEREYKPKLLAVAARFCPDSQEAEALVYRTMDEVIRCIETLADPESFFGWMCGIMSNQFRKLNRRKINGKIAYTNQFIEVTDETIGVDSVVQAVDASLLREAIESLPPKLKEAVLLRYFADMPLTQIARFLMIPVGTVNSRLHMARVVLAMRLGAKLKKSAVAMVAAGLFLLAVTAAVVVGARLSSTAETSSGDEATMVPGVTQTTEEPEAAEVTQTTEGTQATEEPEAAASNPAEEASAVSSVPNVPSVSSTTFTKGETIMKKGRAAAAALSAAMIAAAPVSATVLQGASSLERSIALVARDRTHAERGFDTFLARDRDIKEQFLGKFRSDEPKGIVIVFR